MSETIIDMRSDTVTRPTAGMRQAIANAEVGDDMFAEDPTVNRLEARMCELLGKEAGVVACSGTQSNQMGVRTHCIPGDELLIEATGHIANFEGGAPAALSGVTCRLVPGRNGMLDIPDLEGKIRADNQHFTRSRLLCLENTTNVGGGRVYPLEQVARVCGWAHEQGLKTHLDGARVFNASIAGGYSLADLAKHFDTVSICFSKGLGCPMGSILLGNAEDIARARRIRKIFGGAMRQAGIMAAACLYALDHNVERLKDDHANAQAFADALGKIPGITLDSPKVETNIVFFDVDPSQGSAAELAAALQLRNVRISASGPQRLRGCTHLDVDRQGVLAAARAVADSLAAGLAPANTTGASAAAAVGPYARA